VLFNGSISLNLAYASCRLSCSFSPFVCYLFCYFITKVLATILHTHGTTRHLGRLFERLRAAPTSKPSTLSTFSYCVSIPRLLLTPSRFLVTSFELEISNRVIRKFVEEEGFCADAFLRVLIANENGMNLFNGDLDEELESSIMLRMRSGISIYGRRYEFLAYSTSQLKECSVWMVCPEKGWSVERSKLWSHSNYDIFVYIISLLFSFVHYNV